MVTSLQKYVRERFGDYYIFGEHEDGKVDVVSPQRDPVATVTRVHAVNLIEDRAVLVETVVRLAEALNSVDPDKFKEIWYNGNL